MNRNILGIYAIVLAVLLAGIVTDDGVAGTSDKAVKKGTGSFSRPEARTAVTVAGTLSGSLQGQIRLSGREVVITKQTRIYRTGKGLIKYGSLVTNSPVYVIGDSRDGVTYARLVVVSDRKERKKGGEVRKLSPDEPL